MFHWHPSTPIFLLLRVEALVNNLLCAFITLFASLFHVLQFPDVQMMEISLWFSQEKIIFCLKTQFLCHFYSKLFCIILENLPKNEKKVKRKTLRRLKWNFKILFHSSSSIFLCNTKTAENSTMMSLFLCRWNHFSSVRKKVVLESLDIFQWIIKRHETSSSAVECGGGQHPSDIVKVADNLKAKCVSIKDVAIFLNLLTPYPVVLLCCCYVCLFVALSWRWWCKRSANKS